MTDPASRIEALLVRAEEAFRAEFLSVVNQIREKHTLTALEQLLEQRRFDEAFRVIDRAEPGREMVAGICARWTERGRFLARRRPLRYAVRPNQPAGIQPNAGKQRSSGAGVLKNATGSSSRSYC